MSKKQSPITYTGDQFRQWREESPKVTITDLAELSGCTQSQISNFELGKTDVKRGTMAILLSALAELKKKQP